MSPTRRSFVKAALASALLPAIPIEAPSASALSRSGHQDDTYTVYLVGSYAGDTTYPEFFGELTIAADGSVSLRDVTSKQDLWEIDAGDLYSLPQFVRELRATWLEHQLTREARNPELYRR
jgi:hypothetical protein